MLFRQWRQVYSLPLQFDDLPQGLVILLELLNSSLVTEYLL